MGITEVPAGGFIQAFHALAEHASAAAAMLVEVTEEPGAGARRTPPLRDSGGLSISKEGRAETAGITAAFDDPLQRRDIRQLVTAIDGIIDQAHGVADKAILFGLRERISGAAELARILRRQTLEIQTAIRAVGAGGSVRERSLAVHRLEVEADGVFQEAIRSLFREEKDPIRLLKAREILESIHQATDACEDAATILETIALK